jgi:hypothetical protein
MSNIKILEGNMKEKTVRRRDDLLEKAAKGVFGADIVAAAYVTTYRYDDCTVDEIDERLERAKCKEKLDYIDNSSKTVIIEFKNGRVVRFTNSEWGSISTISLSDVEVW